MRGILHCTLALVLVSIVTGFTRYPTCICYVKHSTDGESADGFREVQCLHSSGLLLKPRRIQTNDIGTLTVLTGSNCENLLEDEKNEQRRFFSDSFGGSIDTGAKGDGSSSFGGSVHTPAGSVSGHAHFSHGDLSGGDIGVSGNVGKFGSAGVHANYDNGHVSGGVDAGVDLGGFAHAQGHVDVDHNLDFSGGVNAGVDLGGFKETASLDIDHNGHATGGIQGTFGRRDQGNHQRRFFSDSFGGSIDSGAKGDGSSSVGGSVHTPAGSVSSHAHFSHGDLSGGDIGVSGNVGKLGSAGVHANYDNGHVSGGVDAGVDLGGFAHAQGHVDVDHKLDFSGGVNAGVDLGGFKETATLDVDHNGHATGGIQGTFGRRDQGNHQRRFFSDSFGGSIDSGAKGDGSSSVGGSLHTPAGSVSGHAHFSHGDLSGGDIGVSGNVGKFGSAGVHANYDNGHISGGVDAGVDLGGLAHAQGHVDVDHNLDFSGGVNAGVDLGGFKETATLDVDHNGHATGGIQGTFGRRDEIEQQRRFFSDSFGGSIDTGAKGDGSSSVGGSVHTPAGSVSGHAHFSHGDLSGGDIGVSGNVGKFGSAGVHANYDHGHVSGGVDAGVDLGGFAHAQGHVDVDHNLDLSGGVNAGVDLGGFKETATLDIDHNGHTTGGIQGTFGRRDEIGHQRRFFSDSFGGSIDSGAKGDGSSSVGGSVHTPAGSVSGHAHFSHGDLSGGDIGVSGNVGKFGSAGVHANYDNGHVSGGVDAGVDLGGFAHAQGHVDVDHNLDFSGGVNAGVDLGGFKETASLDIDHNGHATGGIQGTFGRRGNSPIERMIKQVGNDDTELM
ncbi:uncharacterized transmembrane protein DDB_G0289901-like isoform X4 [Pecten maximus]|uniref:uncharacterized transmembrane protein DDB_G0289901-like isoform X4 n=1 Tax=Pecten maximus TaxID=6579 RepID=UPI0014583562|nr:uncharacterized transmembrane protein DDB_G0289901-like isoform X4 [Pecten maximus]